MKTMLILCIAMISLPITSFAEVTEGTCPSLGDAAAAIMTSRQNEIPMSNVMKTVLSAIPDESAPVFRSIIMMAYDQPSYRTPDNRKRAIDEFRNEIENACYKAASQ